MQYRLLIVFEVIEALDGLLRNLRRSLLVQIGKLRFAPEQLSDHNEYDHIGRRVEVHLFSGRCIHHWIDSADRHVKVMKITLTDRV